MAVDDSFCAEPVGSASMKESIDSLSRSLTPLLYEPSRRSTLFAFQKAIRRVLIGRDPNISLLPGYEATGDLTSRDHCMYLAGVLQLA
jgi:hypothetical protein